MRFKIFLLALLFPFMAFSQAITFGGGISIGTGDPNGIAQIAARTGDGPQIFYATDTDIYYFYDDAQLAGAKWQPASFGNGLFSASNEAGTFAVNNAVIPAGGFNLTGVSYSQNLTGTIAFETDAALTINARSQVQLHENTLGQTGIQFGDFDGTFHYTGISGPAASTVNETLFLPAGAVPFATSLLQFDLLGVGTYVDASAFGGNIFSTSGTATTQTWDLASTTQTWNSTGVSPLVVFDGTNGRISTHASAGTYEINTIGRLWIENTDADESILVGNNIGTAIIAGATDNIIIGQDLANAMTDADNNIIIGENNVNAITTGSNGNVVIGNGIGSGVGGSSQPVVALGDRPLSGGIIKGIGIGRLAGAGVYTGGEGAIFIGPGAGSLGGGNGDHVIAVGIDACRSCPAQNIGFGSSSLTTAGLTGTLNVAMGRFSLTSLSGASFRNSVFGDNGFFSLALGSDNSSLGFGTFATLASGSDNTGVGQNSAGLISSGSNNTFIGSGSVAAAQGAISNMTTVGHQSGQFATEGGNNLFGKDAGRYVDGTGNTIISNDASAWVGVTHTVTAVNTGTDELTITPATATAVGAYFNIRSSNPSDIGGVAPDVIYSAFVVNATTIQLYNEVGTLTNITGLTGTPTMGSILKTDNVIVVGSQDPTFETQAVFGNTTTTQFISGNYPFNVDQTPTDGDYMRFNGTSGEWEGQTGTVDEFLTFSGSTDGAGLLVIAHTLGVTPTGATAAATGTTGYHIQVTALTATNVTVIVLNSAFAPVASTPITGTLDVKQ